jgi:iron(II)-dependent oxidoreductase
MNRFMVACIVAFPLVASGQVANHPPQRQQIPAPHCLGIPAADSPLLTSCSAEEIRLWREDLDRWVREERHRVDFDDHAYGLDALKWAQSSFVQVQMMVEDRYFYDVASHRYTVDRYLDDLITRYGGVDNVLIWHTYPNIGIDNRNQYDLLRDMPGGLEGVRQMVADFHRRGVRVLFPFMVWDRGTRDEGSTDQEAITRELGQVNADGINGDTLAGVPRSYYSTAEKSGHVLALEPELGVSDNEMLSYNVMSWGEGWQSTFVPMLSGYKWFEPRHTVHLVNRWAHDRNDDLQMAFLNGIGYVSWENIWGIWNGVTPRDGEVLRRISAIYRAFSELLVNGQWRPFIATQRFGVFASQWSGASGTLRTLVNRNPDSVDGAQLLVPLRLGVRYYDVWNGRELTPRIQSAAAVISLHIDANGFGAVFEATGPPAAAVKNILESHGDSAATLSGLSSRWSVSEQHMVDIPRAEPMAKSPSMDMVEIPAADYRFRVRGIEIEGQDPQGPDIQYPWESYPRRDHDHILHIDAFWIDRFPVTNGEYKRFMDEAHYRPTDDHNFLHDWAQGSYPPGWERRPVTWVSREDADAYARWAGKRLPHEWEWQYAAQGLKSRIYPWGDAWEGVNAPTMDAERNMQPPSEVDRHPKGASPFGVMDLIGNVWQWTDVYEDEHTRAAVLRGGSHYRPKGSGWYFPQAYRLDEHGKYLLMSPGMDRSASVGFRCARDVRGPRARSD